MEVGFNNPYELEDGEIAQTDWSDHINHVGTDTNYPSKNGNDIANPAIRGGGELQQSSEKCSDFPNPIQRDVSIGSEAGKESAASSFQEGVPSLQNSERLCDYPNHIKRDKHERKDRKDTGDMMIRETVLPHQIWKKRRYDDLNHIPRDGFDVRKTGKGTEDIQEREPSEKIREKQSFHDSNHDGKDAINTRKVGDEAGDMSRTLKNWMNLRSEDRSIVWPPVVIIENIITGFNKTENLWEGLKNNEIRSCLKSIKDLEYKKVMAIYSHQYGHRGSALVIFEANDIGFMNADNLSQCLQRAGRGREDWYRVRPRGLPIKENDMELWNRRGLVGDDGTRTIYGYVVEPSDLNRIKPHLKKVLVESFVKRVLEPMKLRCQETEKACRSIQELEEEAEQKRRALESTKLEVSQVAAQLKKKDDEVQLYRKQQEEAERNHKLKMEENRREFDRVMKEKLLRCQQKEAAIRAQLYAKKMHFEKETEEYKKTENELEQGIEKEKNEQEKMLAEIREKIALRQERLEKELHAKMEKKYAELEERLHKKKLDLQAKHRKQVLELKEKAQKDKQQFLQKKLEEKIEIEKELEIARQEAEKLSGAPQAKSEQASECGICHSKFGPKMSRAVYEDCGHQDVCKNCAKKQKTKKKCPICQKQQERSYVVVPYKIYC